MASVADQHVIVQNVPMVVALRYEVRT